MNARPLLLAAVLLTGCATFPPPEPCRICDASTAPRHDAPVRLFNDDVPTPCGRPHPGWTPALRERTARDRAWATSNLTPMDAAAAGFMSRFQTPVGIERDILLWKPLRRDASAQTVNYDYRDQWGLLPLFPLRK